MDENVALILQELGVKVSVLHRLPSINHSREIIEHYFFDGRIMFSKQKMYAIERDDEGGFIVYTHPRLGNPPLELLYWTQLLKRNMTFIHAAGVVRAKEEAIIFPAWPETGKTSLTITLLKLDRSLKLLGDDTLILSADGVVYPYPRPFAVYRYHMPLFLQYFQRHPLDAFRLNLASFLNRARIHSRILKAFRITEPLWIPCSRIFPRDRIASKGEIKKVYWLVKASSKSDFRIIPGEKKKSIESMYLCLIYDLFGQFFQDAIALTYFGFFNLFDDLRRHYKILEEGLREAKHYQVILPYTSNFNKVAIELLSHAGK